MKPHLLCHVLLRDGVPDVSTDRSSEDVSSEWEIRKIIPVRGYFDPLDPAPISAVRPSTQLDLPIMDDNLFIRREDNRAPVICEYIHCIVTEGEYSRHRHSLNREPVRVLHILLPDLPKKLEIPNRII